jgi:GAF domain-containing protein
MTAVLDDATADPWQIIADLQRKLDASIAELAQRNSEYGERIEQQSATIDVLKVMSASPGDPQPVFDLIVRRAQELCNGWGVTLCEFDGHLVHLSALCGKWEPSAVAAYQAAHPLVPTRASITCRAILDRQVVHIRDINAVPELLQVMRKIGWKSNLALPLLRDGVAIGAISLTSELPGGFSDSQVALLQTFAEQAVIAISSAETYRELRQRTADLKESLEYQTATSDVLKVISRSTFDLQPVLDTLAETAARLCDAGYSAIFRRDGEVYRVAAVVAFSPETTDAARKFQAFLEQHPLVADRGSITGRVALEGRAVHVADTASDPEYTITEATTLGNLRTQLGVPLLHEGEPPAIANDQALSVFFYTSCSRRRRAKKPSPSSAVPSITRLVGSGTSCGSCGVGGQSVQIVRVSHACEPVSLPLVRSAAKYANDAFVTKSSVLRPLVLVTSNCRSPK